MSTKTDDLITDTVIGSRTGVHKADC